MALTPDISGGTDKHSSGESTVTPVLFLLYSFDAPPREEVVNGELVPAFQSYEKEGDNVKVSLSLVFALISFSSIFNCSPVEVDVHNETQIYCLGE